MINITLSSVFTLHTHHRPGIWDQSESVLVYVVVWAPPLALACCPNFISKAIPEQLVGLQHLQVPIVNGHKAGHIIKISDTTFHIPCDAAHGGSQPFDGLSHRKLPLKPGDSAGKHARHEIEVPLPKLKRALFSALRELRREKVPFQGTIDVDLISTLENLAL